MYWIRLASVVFAFLALGVTGARAAELVMVEQDACEWCETWDEEVGVVYAKTPEGRLAPLRRVDIHDDLPGDLSFIKGLVFTPTFVLVDGGKEIGRIHGYPGEDFFWAMLQELLAKLPARSDPRQRVSKPPVKADSGSFKRLRG